VGVAARFANRGGLYDALSFCEHALRHDAVGNRVSSKLIEKITTSPDTQGGHGCEAANAHTGVRLPACGLTFDEAGMDYRPTSVQ
jgi:hypothetical protein